MRKLRFGSGKNAKEGTRVKRENPALSQGRLHAIYAPKAAAPKGKGDGKPGKCGQAYGAHCSRPGRKRNVRKRQRSLPMRENPNRGVRAELSSWQYAAPDAAKSANGHQKQFVLQTCGASPGTAKACATALDPRLWHGERRIDKKKRIPACAMFRSRNPKNSLQNGLGRKQRNGPLQVFAFEGVQSAFNSTQFPAKSTLPNPMQRPGSLLLHMSPKMAFHRRFLRTNSAGNKEPIRKDRLSCAKNCQYCENHMEKIFPAVQRRERTSERAKSWRRQRIVARALTTEQVRRACLFAKEKEQGSGGWPILCRRQK